MTLRSKVCIVILSLLALVSQSYANAVMNVSMSKMHGEMNMVMDDSAVTPVTMSDHCSDMKNRSDAHDSTDNPSTNKDCCKDVCQCSLGVCSSPLFDNSISLTSFDWSTQPEFADTKASIVRFAASLYRPPISA